MLKFLKTALAVTAITSTLSAEVVFNLGAQQFYNSIEQNFKDSTYDLPNSIVSTALAFGDGNYYPKEDRMGSFSVELKNPQPNWGISFGMSCFLHYDGCGINLLGANGQTISITFDDGTISVNGEQVTDDDYYDRTIINGTIETEGDSIKVIINGEHTFTVDKSNFSLSYLSVLLSDGRTYVNTTDRLSSLAISTN